MRFVAPLLLSLTLTGCAPTAPQKRDYELRVRVDSDPGEGLSNVALYQGARRVGVTDENGTALVRLRGSEGERTTLRAECPDTHLSPDTPDTVVLRSYAGKAVPEHAIHCPPRTRKLAVVVKAKNGADLDIVHRGKAIGRTDHKGTAHLLLEGPPGDAFEISLDTNDRPNLRPQNPGTQVLIAARDEAVLFAPALEVEEPKEPPRRRRKVSKGPQLPQRIR